MRFSAFALFVSESVFAAMRNYAFFGVQLSWLYTFLVWRRFKMKFKKLLAVVLSVIILFGTLPLGTFTVSAATEGIWQYYISGSSACVTGVTQKQSGKVYIPSTLGGYPVTAIGNGSRQFGNLAGCHVVFPQGVTSINGRCFEYCSPASITIPKSLTWVSFCAFNYCWDLTDVYYEGSSSDRSNIRIEYVGIGGNDAFVDATWHYNTPYVYSILDLILENNEITEEDYIKLHVSFSKWFKENNFKNGHSFSDVIWSNEVKNQENSWWNQLTKYKTWDILGDVGKIASFDFNDSNVNADYYKLFLSDLILALNSSEMCTKVELKSFEVYKTVYDKVMKAFKTTDEWNDDIYIDLEVEIKGFILNPDYELSEGVSEKISTLVGATFVEENFETIYGIFEGLDIVNQVCDYISTATDLAEAYKNVQKAYAIAKCCKEINNEFFSVLKAAASKMDNENYSQWFLEALEEYEQISMSDSELYAKAIMKAELKEISYDMICKDFLSDISYILLSKVLGCAPSVIGITVFAYNTYYTLLDSVLGVSDKSVPYYFMNYISPLEKALCLIEEEYASTLQANQTYENAVKYDSVYSLLKTVNLYLYQCAYEYSEKYDYIDDMNYVSLFSDTWKAVNCHILTAKIVDGGKVQSTGSLNSNYTYSSCCGVNEISKYSGSDTSLIIPSKTLDEKNVTDITYNTFYNNKNITTLILSEGITRIESGAFKNCENLRRVVIPKTVNYISNSAFSGCYNLEYIEVVEGNSKFAAKNNCLIDKTTKTLLLVSKNSSIPTDGSVTSIGSYAFSNINLTEINIPECITKIGNYAFSDCKNFIYINLPNTITEIGSCAFYRCVNLQNFTIPNSVTKIGSNAFYKCESITELEIPNSVTSINISAFYYCKNLKNIVLGSGAESIGYYSLDSFDDELIYTFTGCENLENIIVSNENNTYSSNNGVLYNKAGTKIIYYPQGKRNTEYVIYDGVTSIGDYAFYENKNIENVVLPDTVTQIGTYSFANCINLKTISLPKNIIQLGRYAFYNCTSLKTVYFYGTDEQWQAFSVTSGNSALSNAEVIFVCSCGSTDFNEWQIAIAPDCFNGGELQRSCQQCGEMHSKKVSKNTHDILNGKCTICGNEVRIVESAHPYANNTNISTPITVKGAIQLLITFSADTLTERNFDYIYLYDGNGTQIGKYTDTALASQTIIVNGDTITMRITSDGSVTKYGYKAEIIPIYPETGDIDGDGSLGATDLSLLRHALLDDAEIDDSELAVYDINNDDCINIIDLVRLKKKIAGIIA